MPLMQSWVASANAATTPFPLNNLPYGVVSTNGQDPRCAVAIGACVLDLTAVEEAGLLALDTPTLFAHPSWNSVMAEGPALWSALRTRLTTLLAAGSPAQEQLAPHLIPMSDLHLHMPFEVREFTDFYASKHHATNVGTMFRGAENALPANWLHMPIGYNGRASTVVVSGTDITRPCGQLKAPEADAPHFGPSARLDFELELGAIIGGSTQMGETLTVQEADDLIFGYVLLNDWSARDIQAWEYQPLGPFQGKAFATTISPWIVTKAALDPFRSKAPPRDLPLLPYLQEPGPMLYDITLAATLAPENAAATTISQTTSSQLSYSAAQQIAHHASSGCAMRSGDLIGSGTISGPKRHMRGSLLELSWGGTKPLMLDTGQARHFLEDGDTLTLHGSAHGDGYQIGFGSCSGTIRPARTAS